jgi:hydroxymethylpyrimidine/phosphomethylpyrimidine kinase
MACGDGAMALKRKPHVLIVAGTDSSGGAGVSRDIETMTAFGVRTCLALTAVTAQTHQKAGDIVLIDPVHIEAQMRAALSANNVTAIKIGMLGTSGAVAATAMVLRNYLDIPVVLDPVLASTSGKLLLSEDGRHRLRNELMPLCTVVTPNLEELALLSGLGCTKSLEASTEQAEILLQSGCKAILAKGGHAHGSEATDVLYQTGEPPARFVAPRMPGTLRGSGCMLSSAIAASLANAETLLAAVGAAKTHLQSVFSLAN